jgi:subtilisin family serine protease
MTARLRCGDEDVKNSTADCREPVPFPGGFIFCNLSIAALAACAIPFAAMAQMGPPQNRYIVVLNQGLDMPEDVAADVAIRTGGRVGHVYEHAVRGFSIVMPRAARLGVERDPRVSYVEEDKPVSIFAPTIPTSVQRIFADGNGNIAINGSDDYRVDVDVAGIDTGIDFEHPDLNVAGGVDYTHSESGGPPWMRTFSCGSGGTGGDDDHYHGTHVAGTIAAIDGANGVVGVAPGARLWAVKVLDSNGSGYESGIVAGIDWVAANAETIEVANMSLSGSGFSQAEYDAIQGAVEAGVAFAVAVRNSDDDANNYSPAAFDNALTVSALADFDGEAGGNGSPTCRTDQDDTLADFSNWATRCRSPRRASASSRPTRSSRASTEPSAAPRWPHRTPPGPWRSRRS